MILLAVGLVYVFIKRQEIVFGIQDLMRGERPGTSMSPPSDAAPRGASVSEAADRVTPLITAEMSAVGLQFGDPVFIRIFKESNELEVWGQLPNEERFELYKVYRLCGRTGGLGPKATASDGKTPEGFYFIDIKSLIPVGPMHFGLDLGFPNQYDQHHQRNGSSAIHGSCEGGSHFTINDSMVEELYTMVAATLSNGHRFIRVHCFPFRMTDERMDQAVTDGAEHVEFWANLKEGYDFFEIVGKPPTTKLLEGRYAFE